jgi:hypothetical protein
VHTKLGAEPEQVDMEKVQAMRLPLHPKRRLLTIKAMGGKIGADESKYFLGDLAFALGIHDVG